MNLDDLNKELQKFMETENSRGIPEFEGYSPNEMHEMMYAPFFSGGLLQLKKLPEAEYQNIPIFRLFKNLTQIVAREAEIKLTATGALPTKFVIELYQKSNVKDFWIESGLNSLRIEKDCDPVHLAHILLNISGLSKIRNGKLSLTKKGEKILADDHETLQIILQIFGLKLNWAYFDGFGENLIGQRAFAFSIALLSLYGAKSRPAEFYARKYFRAFPTMLEELEFSYRSQEEAAIQCYVSRTFARFFDYLGWIEPCNSSHWDSNSNPQRAIVRTALFEMMIVCKPPLNKKNYH